MSRVYEVMFIIRPDVDDDEAEKLFSLLGIGRALGLFERKQDALAERCRARSPSRNTVGKGSPCRR